MTSRAELEAVLDADPYDVDAYRIYADALQEEGDPRGEFISLAVAAEADPQLEADVFRYRLDHEAELVGEIRDLTLAPSQREAFRWRFGFIHALRLEGAFVQDDSMAERLDRVLAHPSGRFLVELEIGPGRSMLDENLRELLARLAGNAPASLRVFKVGMPVTENPEHNYWHQGEDLSAIWKSMPRLRRIVVRGGRHYVGELDLPELETFAFQVGGLNSGTLKALVSSQLPQLRYLDVFGDHDDSIETMFVRSGRNTVSRCDGTFADLAPLLERTDLPALRHLGIANALFTDELCDALPRSRLLPQLDDLDVSHGSLTDDGARRMAAARQAFAHLRRLDVSRNYLTDGGITALHAIAGPRIITEDQRPDVRRPR